MIKVSNMSHNNKGTLLQPKYRFLPLADVYNESLAVEWLVRDYIPSQSVGMIYGPSGAGKSHIAFDIAVCIANGLDWCDKSTKQGHVLIMAGEGHNGLTRRLKSIEKVRDIEINTSNISISERAIGIDSDAGLKEVIDAIDELDAAPDLIIIDTLSRHLMESSENSNEDMAKVVINLEYLMRKYNTAVLLVHHTGKNPKSGSRGASSLRANIDFSFVVEPFIFQQLKHCELKCEKQKDASDDLPPLSFGIEVVELDECDDTGKPITGACVIPVAFVTRNKSQDYKDIALNTFMTDKSEWQKAFVQEIDGELSDDSKKRKFREIVKKLVDDGWVKEFAPKKYQITTH
jgi:hypothetical protein